MTASTLTYYPVPPYTGRHLDPIRAAALKAAIKATHDNPDVDSDWIITLAKLFEAYLAGEKAEPQEAR